MAGLDADVAAGMNMPSVAGGIPADAADATRQMIMPSVTPGIPADAPASGVMNMPALLELSGSGAPDTVDPSVVVLSPAEGTPIDIDTELVVRVFDNIALANVVFTVRP